jgi:hypothetical protein
MRRLCPPRLAALLAVLPCAAHAAQAGGAASPPCEVVRAFFDALSHRQLERAVGLTAGAARARVVTLLNTIIRKAEENDADFAPQVRSLEVAEAEAAAGPASTVEVAFAIDVVGKKWFVSRVARTLGGKVQFVVSRAGPARIVDIVGKLE